MKLTSTPTVTVAVRLATSGSEKEESRCGEFVTERKKEVKIGMGMTTPIREELTALLKDYHDIFAWSYQDMPGLRLEIHSFKESNGKLENEIRNQNLIISNPDAQHSEEELKEARNKVLALEVELEKKNSNCKELEAKCIELQFQLERYESSLHICFCSIFFLNIWLLISNC